jgi:hypothetical protein
VATPVTTTEILLQQVVDVLTDIRDLLRQAPPAAAAQQPAPTPSKPSAARRTTAPRKPKE